MQWLRMDMRGLREEAGQFGKIRRKLKKGIWGWGGIGKVMGIGGISGVVRKEP